MLGEVEAHKQKLQKLQPVLERVWWKSKPKPKTTETTGSFRMCQVDLKSQAKATETTNWFEIGIPKKFLLSAQAQS